MYWEQEQGAYWTAMGVHLNSDQGRGERIIGNVALSLGGMVCK